MTGQDRTRRGEGSRVANHVDAGTGRDTSHPLTNGPLLPLKPPHLVLSYLSAALTVIVTATSAVWSMAISLPTVVAIIRRWRCGKWKLCPLLPTDKGVGRHACDRCVELHNRVPTSGDQSIWLVLDPSAMPSRWMGRN